MNINHNVELNLSVDGIPPRLHMPQGDSNTRTIVAALWDGAQPYNIPAGAVVMMRFRKPDGTGGLYDTTEAGSKVTFSGNTVTAPVATQMLAVAGIVQAQIDICGTATGKNAETLATFRFAVEVAPNVYPDAEIISSDYYNIVAAQIAAAIEAGEKYDAAIQAAQTATAAATTATNAKNAAVNAKTAAENAKTAAESAKADAVSAKNAAAGSATAAANSATAAGDASKEAEAWAVGKRSGVDVPSSDPAYHNNAKYWADQAQQMVVVNGSKLVFTSNGQTAQSS